MLERRVLLTGILSGQTVTGNIASLGEKDSYTFSATAGGGTAGTTLTVSFTVINQSTNHAPVVANTIPNQTATFGAAFSFAFASNTFTDADGDALTYSALLSSNAALPAWLSFNASTRTFSGTPPTGSTTPTYSST